MHETRLFNLNIFRLNFRLNFRNKYSKQNKNYNNQVRYFYFLKTKNSRDFKPLKIKYSQ